MVHVIRLRRPWEKSTDQGLRWERIGVPEPVESPEVESPEVESPAAESPAIGPSEDTVEAVVMYRRNFNSPSGLEPDTRVMLRVDRWQGRLVSVAVNESELEAETTTFLADITDMLRPHNQIVLRLTGSSRGPARLSGEVSLEIHEAANPG